MITVLSINLNYQAKTLENLQTIYAYEQEELTAIARLKKRTVYRHKSGREVIKSKIN